MQELGINETTMKDGSKVTVKEGFHCRIPKAREDEALQYLKEERSEEHTSELQSHS